MTTLLLTHPACLEHVTPPGHPERPDRLRAINQVLSEERFKSLVRGEAPEGSLDLVLLCHSEAYVTEPVIGRAFRATRWHRQEQIDLSPQGERWIRVHG